MMITTVVLFLLPCTVLLLALRRYTSGEGGLHNWRTYCGGAALISAGCSTVLELVFFVSWFHNGGSPHGMTPSPGIWKVIGRISAWFLIASLALSAFGKGKWRSLIPAWAATLTFVAYALFTLEME
jgi:hypothetical protein